MKHEGLIRDEYSDETRVAYAQHLATALQACVARIQEFMPEFRLTQKVFGGDGKACAWGALAVCERLTDDLLQESVATTVLRVDKPDVWRLLSVERGVIVTPVVEARRLWLYGFFAGFDGVKWKDLPEWTPLSEVSIDGFMVGHYVRMATWF